MLERGPSARPAPSAAGQPPRCPHRHRGRRTGRANRAFPTGPSAPRNGTRLARVVRKRPSARRPGPETRSKKPGEVWGQSVHQAERAAAAPRWGLVWRSSRAERGARGGGWRGVGQPPTSRPQTQQTPCPNPCLPARPCSWALWSPCGALRGPQGPPTYLGQLCPLWGPGPRALWLRRSVRLPLVGPAPAGLPACCSIYLTPFPIFFPANPSKAPATVAALGSPRDPKRSWPPSFESQEAVTPSLALPSRPCPRG